MNEILERAIYTFGPDCQTDKCIEEMSELTKALLKLRYCENRYERQIVQDAVDEEMADVEIMLAQLKLIFNNHYRVEMEKEKKLERLERRINGTTG